METFATSAASMAASSARAAHPLTPDEMIRLWHQLLQPEALVELVAFLGCLALVPAGAHDVMVQTGALPFGSVYWLYFVGPLVMMCHTVIVAGDHARSRQAVNDLNFSLSAGETLGIVGESGSGKSSLAMAVLGLMPYGGELTFEGKSWQGSPGRDKALRQKVQVVFQDPFGSLSPRMTVGEIVSEGLRLHRPHLSEPEIEAQVVSALSEVGLMTADFPDLLNRYPHAFSGGQRQRIALARALVVEPDLLVLDEPTSALDVTVQKQILSLLQTLQKNRRIAYLMITHDIDVLRAMAHQVMVLRGGLIVEAGPAEQVLHTPHHNYTRSLLAAFPGD